MFADDITSINNIVQTTMKKIVSFVLTAFVLVTTSCFAQAKSEFDVKFEELFLSGVLGNSFNVEQLKPSFTQMAVSVVGQANAEAKATEYIDNHCKKDFVEMVIPAYKSCMTLADLDYLLECCKTPEAKVAASHIAYLNSVEGQTTVQQMMMPGIMSLMQGQPVEKIKSVDCPDSYKKKCAEFTKVSGMSDDMLETLFSAYGQMGAQLSGAEAEAFAKLMDSLKAFMMDNLDTMYINASYGKVTEADFDFYIGLYSSKAGQNFVAGNKKLLKDLMTVTTHLIQKYALWLQANK